MIDVFWINTINEGRISVFFRGNMQLIPRADIGPFLDWIDGKRTLLGAEGFLYDGKYITSLMDCIADYSYGEPTKSIEFHKNLITMHPDWQKAQFVEFVFDD